MAGPDLLGAHWQFNCSVLQEALVLAYGQHQIFQKNLTIENAFIITFLFALLIFSNTWGYINNIVLNYVYRVFPNIQFYRPDKDRTNWFIQAIIGGVAATLAAYIIGGLFTYIGEFLHGISY